MDNRTRSIAKSFSWRMLGTVYTVAAIFILTGQIKASLLFGGSELVIKMVMYYFHERTWNKIKWGQNDN